ncbi:secreted frizzled-related protein 1a isoform X2 [Festucalex cinctus]
MKTTSQAAFGVILLLTACGASEYEYLSWKSTDSYNGGRSYGKPPQCVDIPDDLRLCHNVGYAQMLLPNLLEHETMAEVKQQASSWVPLVHKNCHPGTQVFLCSLFAPVCLERPIYPCRWLCEAVRDGCTPIMEAFGFPWPEMLTCDKYPQDDVCIAMTQPNATESTKQTGYSPICPPCDNEMKTDAMLEHMCASEFACKCIWCITTSGSKVAVTDRKSTQLGNGYFECQSGQNLAPPKLSLLRRPPTKLNVFIQHSITNFQHF